jgi:hypothetical protein
MMPQHRLISLRQALPVEQATRRADRREIAMLYRIFLLDRDGETTGLVQLPFESDQEASQIARAMLTQTGYEIWESSRFVEFVWPEGWTPLPKRDHFVPPPVARPRRQR